MHTSLRKLLITLPITLALASSAWAQTTAIEGDVKGVDGKGLAGAQIKITRTDIKANYKVKTDKKGHFYYGGLSIGTYNITLEVDGMDVDQVSGYRSTLGDPKPVNFDMKEIQARNGGGGAASGAAGKGGAAPAAEPERGMSAAQKAEYEKKKKEEAAAMAKNKELNDAFNVAREAQTGAATAEAAAKKAEAAGNNDEAAKQIAERDKDLAAAIDAFTKASVLDPNQHVVWGNMADSYAARAATKTGADATADYTKAAESYQKAIVIKPDDAAYHNNYALVLAKNKKFEEAQAELTKSAQLDPQQAGKYYFNLGAVYVNTGQNDPATEAFKKAIELDPNYSEAYYQLGLTLFAKATTTADGKIVPPAGTADAFQKYLELAPTGPNVDSAKAMLEAIGSKVETSFQKPGQKAPATKKK